MERIRLIRADPFFFVCLFLFNRENHTEMKNLLLHVCPGQDRQERINQNYESSFYT